MNLRQRQFIKSLPIIGSCLYLSSFLCATPSQLESNSPFLPPGYSTQKPTPPKPVTQQLNSPIAQELEFRGVVQLDGIYLFSIFQKSENKGYWISEDGLENGIQIGHFDIDSMQITVTFKGRTEQLALIAASENPLPVATSAPPLTTPSPGLNNPTLPPGIRNPNQARNIPPPRRTIPRRRVILPNKR